MPHDLETVVHVWLEIGLEIISANLPSEQMLLFLGFSVLIGHIGALVFLTSMQKHINQPSHRFHHPLELVLTYGIEIFYYIS